MMTTTMLKDNLGPKMAHVKVNHFIKMNNTLHSNSIILFVNAKHAKLYLLDVDVLAAPSPSRNTIKNPFSYEKGNFSPFFQFSYMKLSL